MVKETKKKVMDPVEKATVSKKDKLAEELSLSSFAKIEKYAEMTREDNCTGDVLVVGTIKHRMNKNLEDLLPDQVDRVAKILKIDDHITQVVIKGKAKAKAKAARKAAKVTIPAKPCECGCGAMAKPGSKFLPGHDMKLKSILKKKVLGNHQASAEKAKKELIARGWPLPAPPKKKASKKAKK